jgi:hypothetical protein
MDAVVEAINLLRQGAKVWNAREPGAGLDLTHVEIRNAPLAGADFRGVDFDGSAFLSVDLSGACFDEARLNGVDMERVRLDGATLRDAEFKGSDIDRSSARGACLDGLHAYVSKIRRSDLQGITLRGARLEESHIYNCDLTGADFSDAAPDGLALKRVVAARGLLDRLRSSGCRIDLENVPRSEDWIDWDTVSVPDRAGEPAHVIHGGRVYWFAVDRWDFFISHASEDKEQAAKPLRDALEADGQRVWLDEGEILANDTLDEAIEFGTRAANFGVAILSPRFFGRRWTNHELDLLDRKEVFLVLHDGFTLDDLPDDRPSLRSRLIFSTSDGPSAVAHELIKAISRPRGEL